MGSFSPLDEFLQIVNKYEDPRTRDWYLMTSPIPTLAITAIYLFLVKVCLPSHMNDRKPYQLKKIVLIHNFVQVLVSTWLFYSFLARGWLSPKLSSKCLVPRADKNMITVSYLYFLSKFVEFIDTVLFILRKKTNQVTNLHLYHHSIMPIGSWIAVKYVPDSTMTFLGLINSFIHIVMYTYYLLSAFGPKMQKFLWWKKYVTVLQLVQFVLSILNSVQAILFGCLPTAVCWWNITNAVLFFVMFFDFYNQSYKKNQTVPTSNGIHKKVDFNYNIMKVKKLL